jgi:ATP-binding cassette subfamily B protein
MEKDKEKIDFKYNLKIYWNLLKKYKFYFIAVLLMVLIGEAISVNDKFLFKLLVDKSTLFASSQMMLSPFIKILLVLGGIFIATSITRTVTQWLQIHWINRLDAYLIQDLKRFYFNHILTLSHSFHTTHKTGSMISRLSRGGRAIERMTDTIIFSFAPLIFQFIAATFSLILLDFISAIIIFITIIVFLIYNFINQQIQKKSSVIANNTEDLEKANIGDIFTNIDSIKYFGKEKFIKNRFEKLTANTKENFLKNWDYFRWGDAGQRIILSTGTFFLILFSMQKFLAGDITIGTIVFIYTLYLNLMGPLYSFTHGMREYYRLMADFESLFQYGKIQQEVKDSTNAKKCEIKNGEIKFKNINFSYAKRKIFGDFNLQIKKGQKVALVGHSGSGKSTLVKLLYRLYDLNGGEILIDGESITNFKQESLREEMSIVPQECVLFDDTIYNNVAFSNPNATKQEVLNAINFAQLDKIIAKFPKKEQTIVGERGVKLSGGEKQRVSIARALLANKKILVLDEATSSLDSQTEHDIQKDLLELMKNRTSIIIAHRLSTIMSADKIVVMKEGKIVQIGTHNELIQKPGEYKKLWNLQKGGYIK